MMHNRAGSHHRMGTNTHTFTNDDADANPDMVFNNYRFGNGLAFTAS